LAVMLYEMVTGLQPYHADSTERLERMIRSRIPPPPAPDPCPESLRRILNRALAPAPEARYQTAGELASDLRAFREGQAVEAAEDPDATRRTFRRPDPEGDATRRTSPVPARSEAAPQPAPRPRPGLFGLFLRGLALLMVASVMYGSWLVISSYYLWKHGSDLQREVETEQITDPDQLWTKWTELSKGNPSSLLLSGSRKRVKQKFMEAADHVINAYRNGEPVYEKDWVRARTMAARALAVDPDDAARGKLRIAEGHLARINATAHPSLAEYNLAAEKFTEAQQLMPKSPDPQLGLARVYVYGLKDIDRAYQALQQAGKLGYPMGNRERALLADGYRARGDRTWWDSRNVRGLPQERDQIQRAADDYQRAIGLYQEIAPFGNANDGIVKAEQSLESVTSRLQQIAQPSAGK
jgi:tetratricopeptide (TPR) repeat protein